MKEIIVASLLRRGMYKEAEKEAYRKHISYFDFCELVKRFYHGSLTEDGANSIEEEQTNMGKIQEYEYTPTQMAEKLLEFNRDFSDSAEDIQNEKEYVAELFEKLQNSNEFNILAHYLDTMFMDEVFNK